MSRAVLKQLLRPRAPCRAAHYHHARLPPRRLAMPQPDGAAAAGTTTAGNNTPRSFSTGRSLRKEETHINHSSSSNSSSSNSNSGGGGGNWNWGRSNNGSAHGGDEPSLGYKMLESAATSFASVLVLAVGFASAAYAYHKLYKRVQLQKIANAFEPGDPVLELAALGKGRTSKVRPSNVHRNGDDVDKDYWVHRPEQAQIDAIVGGNEYGHYHLLLGEKGTGKSSMIIEAMRKIDGDGGESLSCTAVDLPPAPLLPFTCLGGPHQSSRSQQQEVARKKPRVPTNEVGGCSLQMPFVKRLSPPSRTHPCAGPPC